MTGRKTIDQITSDELDQLYDQLDTLRTIARGYCPACGRGDATPTTHNWQHEHDRAQRLAATLTEVLDRYKPHPVRGPVLGYISHPIDQHELDRWRAALNPRAQHVLDLANGREEPRTTANNQAATEATMPRGTPCVCGGIAPAHDQHAGEHRPMGAP